MHTLFLAWLAFLAGACVGAWGVDHDREWPADALAYSIFLTLLILVLIGLYHIFS